MQVRPALAIALATVTAITVSACSAPPSTPSADTPSAPVSGSPSPVALPVADVFDAPSWGVQFQASSAQKRPVVTAQRLIMLDGQQVRALDPQGKDAWSTPWEGFTDEARSKGSDGYPFLRLVAPDVVAVLDGGIAAGDGLDKDAGQVKVTLLNVQDGSLIKNVAIPGTPGDIPKIGNFGLGFALPQGGLAVVTPDGEVTHGPPTAGKKPNGAISVGSTGIGTWASSDGSANEGFYGPSWDSQTAAPRPPFTSASILAADADRLLVGRWVIPSLREVQVQVQVLDAATGKVLAKPACEPRPTALLTASPSRAWQVLGPMRLDGQGRATCFGGGAGQKTVELTAITDTGRAFGTASAEASSAVFVDLAPTGEIKTSAMPENAARPIGVMDGEIVIHWDANEAIVTGNKIR